MVVWTLVKVSIISTFVARANAEQEAKMVADGTFPLKTENVEDYPRPPRLEPVTDVLRVELCGSVVAETNRGLRILETYHPPTYYFPRADVLATLTPISGSTFCEWKVAAQYFDVSVGQITAGGAAWTYETPSSEFAPLAGYVSFYAGKMSACFVGSVQVLQQPGDFYGGWITPNLEGRIKGAPGTRHW